MAEKTPVSVLQELCIQEGASVPMYDEQSNDTDPKLFIFVVHAFGKCARGTGRSKREAKHKASEHLISKFVDIFFFIYSIMASIHFLFS